MSATARQRHDSPELVRVDGRPALELRDEDREALAERLAELLIDAIASSAEAAR